MSPTPMPVSVLTYDQLYRPIPLTPAERRQAIAAILAVGVRRRLEQRHTTTSFSADRSSTNLSDLGASGLANPSQKSVTVHMS